MQCICIVYRFSLFADDHTSRVNFSLDSAPAKFAPLKDFPKIVQNHHASSCGTGLEVVFHSFYAHTLMYTDCIHICVTSHTNVGGIKRYTFMSMYIHTYICIWQYKSYSGIFAMKILRIHLFVLLLSCLVCF